MKKIVLSVMVIGSLLATSCKEAKKEAKDLKEATKEVTKTAVDDAKKATDKVVKDAVNNTVDSAKKAVTSALEGVSIPEFSNPEVTKNLQEYAAYAKDYIAANGNVTKIAGMAKKGAEILAKGKELASKLDAKEMSKYKTVLSSIQAKMAPKK